MARVYDIESLLSDIRSFLVANLNTKLLAIDTEKADSITLTPFDSAAYVLQRAGEEVANYNPVLLYGISTTAAEAIGPGTGKKYTLHVITILSDQFNDPDIVLRLLRYQRALTELFEKDWSTVGNGVNFLVTGLEPVSFDLLNRQSNDWIIGVNLEVVLG